jgi:DNA-binding MarR family transcriptional regulator
MTSPTTQASEGMDSPEQVRQRLQPWILITQLYWMSYKLLERRFYKLGVSASQARVLALLHDAQGPMKPSLVATLLFQETQSITGILHRIEAKGWVRRTPDPDDRRAISLDLTPAGRELAADIMRISDELYRDMFEATLSPSDRGHVERILKKVRGAAFRLPETDFKLRRAQEYPLWRDSEPRSSRSR